MYAIHFRKKEKVEKEFDNSKKAIIFITLTLALMVPSLSPVSKLL